MRALTDERRALRRGDVKTAPAHETPRANVIAMAVGEEDVRHVLS
jgi:hypothetical protein